MDQNRIAMIAQFVRTDPTPITATNMTEVDGTLSTYTQEGGFDWDRLHSEAVSRDATVLPQGAPYWANGLPLSMLGFWSANTRGRLAGDPHMPGPLLALMAGDPAASVRDQIAANPATPPEIRQSLAPASPASAPGSAASASEMPPTASVSDFSQPAAPDAPTQAIPFSTPGGFSQPSAPEPTQGIPLAAPPSGYSQASATEPTQAVPLVAPSSGFSQPSAPEPTQAFPVGGQPPAGGPGATAFAQPGQPTKDKGGRNKLLTFAGIGAAAMLLLVGLLFAVGVGSAYTTTVVDQEATVGPASTEFSGEYDISLKSERICGDNEDYLGCLRSHEAVYKTVCTLKLSTQGDAECGTLKAFITSARAKYKACGRGCRTKATGGIWGRPYLKAEPVMEEVPGETLPEISHEAKCSFNLGPIKLGDCTR